jgi:hypothetical protein
LNNRDEVTGGYSNSSGNFGFIYKDGSITTLAKPPAGTTTFGYGINNSGVVVGFYNNGTPSSNPEGFIAVPDA